MLKRECIGLYKENYPTHRDDGVDWPPIVVTNINVFEEIIGKAGLFADPAEPEVFADQMINLLNDNLKRERLEEIVAERVIRLFPLNQTANGHIQIYCDPVARK